jgi:ankyrin repeat protein
MVDGARGDGGVEDDDALLALFHAIASGPPLEAARTIESTPALAIRPLQVGGSRQDAARYFLAAIGHHVYAGDTALHVAAAAHELGDAELLVAHDADVRARNRRGAEPLHYAADARPGSDAWDPAAQAEVIAALIDAGADPNALDVRGVAPIHRAVRTRSALAVSALIVRGANPRLRNGSGSTPLHLAVQATGRSNAGSEAARAEQARIIAVLLERGAHPTDADAKGTTVAALARSEWIRRLLGLP